MMVFPKVPDQHKPDKPLVPNGLGIFYVLLSVIYLFVLYYFFSTNGNPKQAEKALSFAVCILFGGFMGLIDDWMDLRWRYKAFLPIIAALPLAVLRQGYPVMSTYFFGRINFKTISFWVIPGEIIFYFAVIPLIVTVTTNSVNQLGGLNGLETLCPTVVMFALLFSSGESYRILLYFPLIVNLVLGFFNFQGKIFVGNTGSFALGITLASYAIIVNAEQTLLISILPYIFNSSIKLLNILLFKRLPKLELSRNVLRSDHRRSLLTLIVYYKPLTERKLVSVVLVIFAVFAFFAVLAGFYS